MGRTALFPTVVILFSCFAAVTGFMCYTCSYGENDGNRRECITDPDALGNRIECNSTSYCVLQEQYDIGLKKVTSYFRSCSGTSWGIKCDMDWSHVTCKSSCQGSYCNLGDKGERYRDYLEKHKDRFHHPFNGTQKATCLCLNTFIICLMAVTFRRWLF